MVLWAQIGDSPNVGIFILRFSFFFGVLLLGNVVDTGFVSFSIGVDHWGAITMVGAAFALHMALFLAVVAYYIWVARAFAANWSSIDHRSSCVAGWGRITKRLLLSTNGSNLINFFVGELVPKECFRLSGWHGSFNGCNLLRPFAVIMNGLQLP